MHSRNEHLEYDHLGFTIRHSEIKDHIYLPKYYNPEIHYQLASLEQTHDLIELGSLIDQEILEVQTGDEVGKLNYGTGDVPFIRTSDLANWEIKADPKHGLSGDVYAQYQDRQDIRENDILLVRDGTYLVGTCAMITRLDTRIVYQSHIYKIRSKDHEIMNPFLLLAVLSSPIVQNQIYAKRFTQDIIDTLGARLYELVIPIPKDVQVRRQLIEDVQQIMEAKVAARQRISSIIFNVAPAEEADPESEYSFFLRNIG